MSQYLPVITLMVLAILFGALSFVGSRLLAPRRPSAATGSIPCRAARRMTRAGGAWPPPCSTTRRSSSATRASSATSPTMPPSMWQALVTMIFGFYCFYALALTLLLRAEKTGESKIFKMGEPGGYASNSHGIIRDPSGTLWFNSRPSAPRGLRRRRRSGSWCRRSGRSCAPCWCAK